MEHIPYHYRVILYRTFDHFEHVGVGVWLYGDGFNEVAWGHGWDRAAAVASPGYRTAAEIEALAVEFGQDLLAVAPAERDEWGEGPYARFDLREPYPGILAPNESPATRAAEMVRHFVATDVPTFRESPTSPDEYQGRWGWSEFVVEVPDETWRQMTDHAATKGMFPCDWVRELVAEALDAAKVAS